MHIRHKWENLGRQWLHDASQFNFVDDGGIHKTAYWVRKCTICGKYQYKHSFPWFNCEIVGRNGRFELCEEGFRNGKNLSGVIAPNFNNVITLDPVLDWEGKR